MKKFSIALFALLITTLLTAQTKGKYVLVIHGGAGTILKSNMTPEKEKLYKQGLQNALDAGNKILKSGGTAVDAVEAEPRIQRSARAFVMIAADVDEHLAHVSCSFSSWASPSCALSAWRPRQTPHGSSGRS